ncbi:MAG: RNA replicase beta chain [Sanya atkins-like virus 2]|nr:MAG: RNA replicase beta chain [Sanya atkins-like virus 2]
MGPEFRQTLLDLLEEDTKGIDSDIQRMRIDVLKSTLFKKFLGSQSEVQRLDVESKLRFLSNNDRLSRLTIDRSTDLFRYWRDEMSVFFLSDDYSSNCLTLPKCLQFSYCGPGASRGLRQTDFFHKMFSSGLTTTSRLLYSTYVEHLSPRWKLAEDFRLRHHSLVLVPGSKISTVPKDDFKRRNICTEPVLNMFYQLGAKEILERKLKELHNLDVSSQPDKNKILARNGSITRRFATIDLSDASDSISQTLIRDLLPPEAYSVLTAMSCRRTEISGMDEDVQRRFNIVDNYVELNMMSTMGNGFTFPLMTLLFSSLVRSIYRINNIHPKCGVNYSVFGDDIIVLNDLFPQVIAALTSYGFIPNKDKSFSEGFFRESCGGDYYKGHDVRGIYIKRLDNEADFYSSYNRLLHWSVTHGIDIPRVLAYLCKDLSIRFVSQFSSSDSGIRSPRETVWFLPRDKNGSIRFRRLEPIPRRTRVEALAGKNDQGLLLAFLGGFVREMVVTSRSQCRKYKVAKRVCPVWEDRSIWPDSPRFYNREAYETIRISLEIRTLMRLEGLI